MFFAELVETATRRGDGQAPSKQMRKTLMRQHSGWYQTLPADAKRMYTGMARRTAGAKRRDMDRGDDPPAAAGHLHGPNRDAGAAQMTGRCLIHHP